MHYFLNKDILFVVYIILLLPFRNLYFFLQNVYFRNYSHIFIKKNLSILDSLCKENHYKLIDGLKLVTWSIFFHYKKNNRKRCIQWSKFKPANIIGSQLPRGTYIFQSESEENIIFVNFLFIIEFVIFLIGSIE